MEAAMLGGAGAGRLEVWRIGGRGAGNPEDMRIGVAQFDNGELMDDGTVSDALLIRRLTNDMAKVNLSIEGRSYYRVQYYKLL